MELPGRLQYFPLVHVLALLAACTLLALVLFWPLSETDVATDVIEPTDSTIHYAINISQPEPEALPIIPPVNWESVSVKSGDTLSTIFTQQNLKPSDLLELLAIAPKDSLKLQIGKKMHWVRASNGQIKEFQIDISALAKHGFTRSAEGKLQYELIERDADYRPHYASATIENSLFVDGTKAGIPEQVLADMASIFGWDIDFGMDIRQGDHFSLIYDEIFVDGERIGTGNILTARFYNQGREVTAIRYTDPNGRADYYTPEGHNMRKAFLRNPIDFTRISSRFSASRRHPVLHTIVRAHKGTDYAAPTGTPIKAAGDGKIVFAGRKGGYGNTVVLQHGGRYQTLYAHMSAFHRNTKTGRQIKQGQIIGYVGRTGLATGPHLHYEFLVNGVQRDPLKVDLPKAETIPNELKADFRQRSQNLITWLNSYTEDTKSLSEAN